MNPPRAFVAFALLLAAPALVTAQNAAPGNAVRKQQEAAADARLAAVRQQIAALAQSQQQTIAQRNALDGRIAQASQALAAAAMRRQQANAALAASQQKLQVLQGELSAEQAHLARQREALATLLRAAYALGPDSDLRVLLGDSDLARLARALAYAQYLQRLQFLLAGGQRGIGLLAPHRGGGQRLRGLRDPAVERVALGDGLLL